ncbi:MAG TPA: hypothetical protein VNC50_14885 [Planctomycetia bacterium]|nr:hypothetical protein [Planctomycetia bacterium]
MSDSAKLQTRYVNTDLVLESAAALEEVAAAFEAAGLWKMAIVPGDDGIWHASFESEAHYTDPEAHFAALLSAIESLPPELRTVWDGCRRREFNLDFECGDEPFAFIQNLSPELLPRLAAARASLSITLYALNHPNFGNPGHSMISD